MKIIVRIDEAKPLPIHVLVREDIGDGEFIDHYLMGAKGEPEIEAIAGRWLIRIQGAYIWADKIQRGQ